MAIWSCLLLGLFLASRGDEQDQLQCISLDQYPGNCPPNLMTGACYSSREGVTWACLPDGLSGAPNCGGMALPADEEGFYNGYCSFYEKPTTTSTTTTTTPCPARRLRIINRCMEEPIWIAHEAARGLIGPSPQNQLILPDSYFDYCTPDKLTGTRYWPKMLCNDQGVNCLLGSSGGPGEGCSSGGQYDRCAPPLDTKFEATFGRRGAPCSGLSSVDCDFIDVSLVDGWTLPFRLTIHGKCSGPNDLHPTEIDCSGLTLDECPTREFMGKTFYDLQAHYRGYGSVAGCYSPCLKLTDPKWNNSATGTREGEAAPFCCPTPPISPQQCREGPVAQTDYVKAVHRYCPGVYAYCYDDAMGLLQCSADSSYELEFFCPSTMPSWNYVWVTTTKTSSSRTWTSVTRTTTSVTSVTATTTSKTATRQPGEVGAFI
ncbi:unnamed protein product [Effrenium voratum]|uniref:Uncharacterized protein n=1 Tax=Effrenium voratum TaxID=2562239 RepID=A0AA36IV43_9DINO|nr:unnamed protein product [Effrenium voratum]